MDKLLTMKEAATLLGFESKNSYRTVQKYIKEGKLPCVRLGPNVRVKLSDLEKFVEDRHDKGV